MASASPLNADLDNLRRLEECGAAAVVLPSIFEEQIEAEMERYDSLAMANAESFQEALTFFPGYDLRERGVGRYLDYVKRAVEAVDISVIASLNGTTAEGWIAYAQQIEEAGASGLDLNVYFIPTDLTMTGQAVEERYLEILRAIRKAVTIPVAVKLSPYFSAFGNMAMELDHTGADALVLFNRCYQPDIDLVRLRLLNDLQLSGRNEIRLPLLWVAVLCGRVRASLAASTGVETADEVLKYILAGADVVMTTSALLRHGVEYVARLMADVTSWLAARDLLFPRRRQGDAQSRATGNQRRLREGELHGDPARLSRPLARPPSLRACKNRPSFGSTRAGHPRDTAAHAYDAIDGAGDLFDLTQSLFISQVALEDDDAASDGDQHQVSRDAACDQVGEHIAPDLVVAAQEHLQEVASAHDPEQAAGGVDHREALDTMAVH